jgi:regulator of RNase E activity RraA
MLMMMIQTLEPYTTCNIADALVQMGHLNCFVHGLMPPPRWQSSFKCTSVESQDHTCTKVIGRAFTVEFASCNDNGALRACGAQSSLQPASVAPPSPLASAQQLLPPPPHYIDHPDIDASTVVVINIPSDAIHAVWGGLVALRAKKRGVRGAIVSGFVRDLPELRALQSDVWSRGVSSLGYAFFLF